MSFVFRPVPHAVERAFVFLAMKSLCVSVLVLGLTVQLRAASTPDHFVHGFLITGYTLSLTGESRETVLWGAAATGLLMTLPDIIGTFGPHHYMSWPVYTWAHQGGNPLVMLPPYLIHIWMDQAFHRFEGDTWWPRMAGICIVMWVVEIALIYVFFKYVLPR